MEIKRGDLFYAALDETYVGSEQTGVRPVVILQNNIGNEHSPTVIIAPITSKVNSKSIIPTHVYFHLIILLSVRQIHQPHLQQLRLFDHLAELPVIICAHKKV